MAALGQTDYGLLQTVNTLRFNALAVTYRPPTAFARPFASGDDAITTVLGEMFAQIDASATFA